jgi:hypothetical protein
MSEFVWKETYSVGVEEIDRQGFQSESKSLSGRFGRPGFAASISDGLVRFAHFPGRPEDRGPPRAKETKIKMRNLGIKHSQVWRKVWLIRKAANCPK